MINHHTQDIADRIKPLTNRRGVDVVIEHVGEATWAKRGRSLARGGRLVLFAKRLSILGSYMGIVLEVP